jgi:hypothetical protein
MGYYSEAGQKLIDMMICRKDAKDAKNIFSGATRRKPELPVVLLSGAKRRKDWIFFASFASLRRMIIFSDIRISHWSKS